MSETAQTIVVLVVVLAALAYVGRRAWATLRPRRDAAGCASGGCGCGDAPAGAAHRDWAES